MVPGTLVRLGCEHSYKLGIVVAPVERSARGDEVTVRAWSATGGRWQTRPLRCLVADLTIVDPERVTGRERGVVRAATAVPAPPLRFTPRRSTVFVNGGAGDAGATAKSPSTATRRKPPSLPKAHGWTNGPSTIWYRGYATFSVAIDERSEDTSAPNFLAIAVRHALTERDEDQVEQLGTFSDYGDALDACERYVVVNLGRPDANAEW